MAISTQVKQCLDDAASSMRECLAFAAKSEQPVTISTISDILVRLESVEHMDAMLSKFGANKELPKPKSQFGL
jgi:DNA repair photolyase